MNARRDIIRAKRRINKTMRLSRLIRAVAAILACIAVCSTVSAQGAWQQPASDLAAQIAAILGHGSARLMIRNLSSLAVDEIPVIRKLMEQDLRARGITANSAPNDTVVRITLSEDTRGRTWVAEIVQGDNTQVAVVDLPQDKAGQTPAPVQLMLRREALVTSKAPVLSAIEIHDVLMLLTPDAIVVYPRSSTGWSEPQSLKIWPRLQRARDLRGELLPPAQGTGVQALLAGTLCKVSVGLGELESILAGACADSDDPWPLSSSVSIAPPVSGPVPNPPVNSPQVQAPSPTPQIRAFYNATRNYFTGVVSPGMGVELPPFYTAAVFQRASVTALLIGTIDGKILLAANNKLTAVAGTSDWGSDFASINSGCNTGAQIIAAGTGNMAAGNPPADTLRAYEIVGSNAEPRSAPLAIDGTVTALWSAPDGKSVYDVIRNPQNQYEVDSVTALCN
jgi:hypothetical protein